MSFAKGLALTPKTTIFIPDDSVLPQLEQSLGMSVAQLKSHKKFPQLQESFTSRCPVVFSGNSMDIKMRNGDLYMVRFEHNMMLDQQNSASIGIVSTYMTGPGGSTRIVTVQGIVGNGGTLKEIMK